MMKKTMTALAAASALVATPVLAQSVDATRAPAQVEQNAEQMRGGNGGGVLIGLLALAAIIAGIIIAVGGDDNEDLPTSP
ncbi:hypothetical protein [Aurantiacibacter luteus]|uniref:Uncharacterized protein n=1 Tax=Aurantiacibacter luteus TaxID=1581420 RepID=A0A0G9MSR8_9SPHN|nr:hypothetical protein [Aurantiacibacter luteus]KLE33797.1 hypothetical protein AAW00_11975 [Aurantiacibacter luteus]